MAGTFSAKKSQLPAAPQLLCQLVKIEAGHFFCEPISLRLKRGDRQRLCGDFRRAKHHLRIGQQDLHRGLFVDVVQNLFGVNLSFDFFRRKDLFDDSLFVYQISCAKNAHCATSVVDFLAPSTDSLE